jgi:hypothetical protein
MWAENVVPVIEDFLIGFQRDPEAFAEDTDLKRDLFSVLYRHFPAKDQQVEIPRKDLALSYYPERGAVRISPVKTAYPMGLQFDIAILDPGSKRPLSKEEAASETRYARYWEQKVAVGIQIHLCKPEQTPSKYFRKLVSDLKKFEQYKEEQNPEFSGISMLLVQGSFEIEEAEGLPGEYQIREIELPEEPGVFAAVIAENGIFLMTRTA